MLEILKKRTAGTQATHAHTHVHRQKETCNKNGNSTQSVITYTQRCEPSRWKPSSYFIYLIFIFRIVKQLEAFAGHELSSMFHMICFLTK